MVGVLKVMAAVPSLVTVTDKSLVVPPVTMPKASPPVIFTAVPVPVSGNCNEVTPFGSPVKFAVTVPGVAPVAVGLKATLKRQVLFFVSTVLPVRLQAPLLMPVVFSV